MGEILNRYIETALEVMLFATILLVVSGVGVVAKNSLNTHNYQEMVRDDIRSQRELATYLNKGKLVSGQVVDNTVTGDDVIRFVGNFRQEFPIEIHAGKLIKLEKYKINEYGKSNWDIEQLVKELDTQRMNNFIIDPIIDENTGEVSKVVFRRQ